MRVSPLITVPAAALALAAGAFLAAAPEPILAALAWTFAPPPEWLLPFLGHMAPVSAPLFVWLFLPRVEA